MPEARRQLLMAIRVFIQFGEKRLEGNSLNLLSVLAFRAGNADEGLEYAERAVKCFYEADQTGLAAQSLGNAALHFYEQKHWENCVRFALQAWEAYRKTGNSLEAARQGLLLGAGYLGLGEVEMAGEICSAVRQVFEQLNLPGELKNVEILEKAVKEHLNH